MPPTSEWPQLRWILAWNRGESIDGRIEAQSHLQTSADDYETEESWSWWVLSGSSERHLVREVLQKMLDGVFLPDSCRCHCPKADRRRQLVALVQRNTKKSQIHFWFHTELAPGDHSCPGCIWNWPGCSSKWSWDIKEKKARKQMKYEEKLTMSPAKLLTYLWSSWQIKQMINLDQLIASEIFMSTNTYWLFF